MTLYTAIGLMSGTSLDGIDVALIKTDGHSIVERGAFEFFPYEPSLREELRACFGLDHDTDGRVALAEKHMTEAHIAAVKKFGHKADMIGFHGQTIFHDPANGKTWQIGDGELMAQACGMDVVYDFRTNDVLSGGQGAPLLPLYHQVLARSQKLDLPVAILNIGGVANITWIGTGDHDVVAFDTGTGNALINDWVKTHTGELYDKNGVLAAAGHVDYDVLARLTAHPYFDKKAPKSLDRNTFSSDPVIGLGLENGAATLTEFTVQGIISSMAQVPVLPKVLYVTGGGRHNLHLMKRLIDELSMPVISVDTLGWDGDAMEAEGFAYLAVRSLLDLPLSLPTTTGCQVPVTGGTLIRAVA